MGHPDHEYMGLSMKHMGPVLDDMATSLEEVDTNNLEYMSLEHTGANDLEYLDLECVGATCLECRVPTIGLVLNAGIDGKGLAMVSGGSASFDLAL